MKFFLETANIEEIREAASYGILDGATTNPTAPAQEPLSIPTLPDQTWRLFVIGRQSGRTSAPRWPQRAQCVRPMSG